MRIEETGEGKVDAQEDGFPAAPTLRDVARRAEVSLATADRVVNRRPGVRRQTIERVEAAVRELGFERNAAAAALARRAGFKAVALLPRRTNPFVARLADELVQAARSEGLRRLEISVEEAESFLPERLAEAIARAGEAADAIIAMGLDDPEVAAAIDHVQSRGVPVVTLVSDVPHSARHHYVGIDNRAAGRVAASLTGRFLPPGRGEVAVVMGSRASRDHRDRLDGFAEVLAERFPALAIADILETQDDDAQTARCLAPILARRHPPDAIYSIGGGIGGLALALASPRGPRPVVIAHELTPETESLLESGLAAALIVQDPGHEARSAVRVLMSTLTGAQISEDQERIRIEILLDHNLPR